MATSHLNEIRSEIEKHANEFGKVLKKSFEDLISLINENGKELRRLAEGYEKIKETIQEIPQPESVSLKEQKAEAPEKPITLTR